MQSFIQDLFSFEKARYTTVDALASDIVNISKHRIDQVLQKFGVELTWCGDKRLDSNKWYIFCVWSFETGLYKVNCMLYWKGQDNLLV